MCQKLTMCFNVSFLGSDHVNVLNNFEKIVAIFHFRLPLTKILQKLNNDLFF